MILKKIKTNGFLFNSIFILNYNGGRWRRHRRLSHTLIVAADVASAWQPLRASASVVERIACALALRQWHAISNYNNAMKKRNRYYLCYCFYFRKIHFLLTAVSILCIAIETVREIVAKNFVAIHKFKAYKEDNKMKNIFNKKENNNKRKKSSERERERARARMRERK